MSFSIRAEGEAGVGIVTTEDGEVGVKAEGEGAVMTEEEEGAERKAVVDAVEGAGDGTGVGEKATAVGACVGMGVGS